MVRKQTIFFTRNTLCCSTSVDIDLSKRREKVKRREKITSSRSFPHARTGAKPPKTMIGRTADQNFLEGPTLRRVNLQGVVRELGRGVERWGSVDELSGAIDRLPQRRFVDIHPWWDHPGGSGHESASSAGNSSTGRKNQKEEKKARNVRAAPLVHHSAGPRDAGRFDRLPTRGRDSPPTHIAPNIQNCGHGIILSLSHEICHTQTAITA